MAQLTWVTNMTLYEWQNWFKQPNWFEWKNYLSDNKLISVWFVTNLSNNISFVTKIFVWVTKLIYGWQNSIWVIELT